MYQGDWLEGMKDGWGVLVFDDGRKYEGMFKKNLFNGQGTLADNDTKYVGQFVDGECHGLGSLKTSSSTYNGNWEHNL